MPPDADGTCRVCLSFDWECTCDAVPEAPKMRERRGRSPAVAPESRRRKRRQQRSEESSTEETEDAHEDLLAAAQRDSEQWRQRSGVVWGGYKTGANPEAVMEAAKKIAVRADVLSFYVGVCKSPAQRFYEKPTVEWVPHMERFHAMYMLSLSRDMGELEKQLIRACRSVASHKCLNKSGVAKGFTARA